MEFSGRLLGDRYELLSLLAGGGMGQVWRARDTLLRRPVAVKVLRGDVSSDPAFLARFRAEAQHTAALTHPNVAAVYDYGEVPDEAGEHRAYLVMELVDGEPLSALLAREGRLGVPLTLGIVRQVAAALAAAHAAGVVHRDVKPANVLVAPDGLVKITDFGIASSASSLPLTRTGQVIGTAQYLSPEQAQGAKAGPASDVYAAGALAYECLAGRRPFDGESAVQIAMRHIREQPAPLPPDVPEPVRALVERAMAKDPAQRFPDGAALRVAVEQVLPQVVRGPDGQPTVTTTVPLPLPARPRQAHDTAVLPPPGSAGFAGDTAVLAAPDGAAREAAGPGHRRWIAAVAVAVAVVVLALIGAVVVGALHASRPAAPATGSSPATSAGRSASPSTSPRPSGVVVSAADYTGQPVAEVRARLAALGLQVRLVPVPADGVAAGGVVAGGVVAVVPTGELAPGSTVTVSYAAAPAPAQHGNDEHRPGHGHGHGND